MWLRDLAILMSHLRLQISDRSGHWFETKSSRSREGKIKSDLWRNSGWALMSLFMACEEFWKQIIFCRSKLLGPESFQPRSSHWPEDPNLSRVFTSIYGDELPQRKACCMVNRRERTDWLVNSLPESFNLGSNFLMPLLREQSPKLSQTILLIQLNFAK